MLMLKDHLSLRKIINHAGFKHTLKTDKNKFIQFKHKGVSNQLKWTHAKKTLLQDEFIKLFICFKH